MRQIRRYSIRYADNRVYHLDFVFANNHETAYSETSINRSCSNAETYLRETGTFDPICFLYASLSHIYKGMEIYCQSENNKRTFPQTENFFQSKSHLPYAETNENFRDFRVTEN